jgi:hypothetical protein
MPEEPPAPRGNPPAEPGERTDPGMGSAKGPSREPTRLGVGISQPGQRNDAAVAPVVVLAPKRERTVLGVAPAPVPQRPQPPQRETSLQEPPAEGWDLPEGQQAIQTEQSVPLDLMPARRTDGPHLAPPVPVPYTSAPHAAPVARVPVPIRDPSIAVDLSELDSNEKEPSLLPAGVPRHRGRKFLVFLVFLAVVATAIAVGYVRREELRPLLDRLPLKHLVDRFN